MNSVEDAPDRVEESIDERRNAYKLVHDRLLKVTYVDEAGDIVVITVIEKEGVGDDKEVDALLSESRKRTSREPRRFLTA